jgi:glycosyltransferase involved in cell wall biosynthesis
VDLFLPSTADDRLARLSDCVDRTHRIPLESMGGSIRGYELVRTVPRLGRGVARMLDSGDYEVVLTGASRLTQAPEILPYLKLSSLYYAPEHNRAIYDLPAPSLGRKPVRWAKRIALREWIRWFDRRAVRSATRVFTHSAFAARNLREIYGIEPHVLRLGVDTNRFRPLEVPRDRSVLSVGAFHPLKGHDFVIEALATLPAKDRPTLRIVGDRGRISYEASLRRLGRERGVEVETHRDVPHDRLLELYARAGVLAAGQVEEPFGLTVLEAMACATPVVAVDEGGLAESVDDGRTGLKTPRDPETFGRRVAAVLGDPALAERLGAAGLEQARTSWSWDETAREIDRLLDSVANAR